MNRRAFIGLLGAIPIVNRLLPSSFFRTQEGIPLSWTSWVSDDSKYLITVGRCRVRVVYKTGRVEYWHYRMGQAEYRLDCFNPAQLREAQQEDQRWIQEIFDRTRVRLGKRGYYMHSDDKVRQVKSVEWIHYHAPYSAEEIELESARGLRRLKWAALKTIVTA